MEYVWTQLWKVFIVSFLECFLIVDLILSFFNFIITWGRRKGLNSEPIQWRGTYVLALYHLGYASLAFDFVLLFVYLMHLFWGGNYLSCAWYMWLLNMKLKTLNQVTLRNSPMNFAMLFLTRLLSEIPQWNWQYYSLSR